ncbi:MAG: nucleotidyltransferase family protein [Myxococcota bacterium]
MKEVGRVKTGGHFSDRIAAVVLAAGRSSRMGTLNKMFVDVDGQPMVQRVVETMGRSAVGEVVVVTGHDSEALRRAVLSARVTRPVRFVHNPEYAEGLGTSVRAGAGAIDGCRAGVFALGDMPLVRTAHVDALILLFRSEGEPSIVVPTFRGRRGNPILWGERHFTEMKKLSGDTGARHLLENHAASVAFCEVDDAGVLLDVDTPEALAAVRGRGATAPSLRPD